MENLNDKIKLPSNWMLVNPESIWKYLIAISKTGNVFSKEQLIKNGLYTTNDDNISRNLSYLKYLGIIDEERAKGKEQRFKVVDTRNVRDILYELKAGRDDHAKSNLKNYLKEHVLFTTIKDDFFINEKTKTLNELEHFLKDGMPGKTPLYYQKGGEFLIKLLKLATLTDLEGNDITLNFDDLKNFNPTPKTDDLTSSEVDESKKPTLDSSQGSVYFIKIQGTDINLEITVKNVSQLNLIQTVIDSIKVELSDKSIIDSE